MLSSSDLSSSSNPPKAPSSNPLLHAPIPSAAALLNDCVSTLSDIIDDSLTTPATSTQQQQQPTGIHDISMSSIGSNDATTRHLKLHSHHNTRTRRSSKPVVVGDDLINAAAASAKRRSRPIASLNDVPRFARPTQAHMVRQASVQAERDHREYRIEHRKKIERGTGKNGQWKHNKTHKKMIGIPNPKKDRTYSTTLLNTSDTHILTMDMSNLTTHSSLYSEHGELQKG